MPRSDYQPVIGLEVHAQLLTHSKLFSAAATDFGAEPNANTTAYCVALPGLLPVLNNLAIFHHSQKNVQETKKAMEELSSAIKREKTKKPLYLLNLAALLHKQGDSEGALKIITGLKTLADSEEGTLYFDLEMLKRLFLLSSLCHAKIKKLVEFEKDMKGYRELLAPADEDPLSHAKADRMFAIGLLKLGCVDRAKKILESY